MQKSIIYSNGNSSVDLVNDSVCRLTDIQGLAPYSTINSTAIAGFDGATYISEQVEKRSITMIISFLGSGDHEVDIYRLYDVFRIKQEGILRYVSEGRDLKIKCRVLSADCPHNVKPLKMQVQLECADPYWYADEIVSYIATTVGAFEFPFECGYTELITDGTFKNGLCYWNTYNPNYIVTPDGVALNFKDGGVINQDISTSLVTADDVLKITIDIAALQAPCYLFVNRLIYYSGETEVFPFERYSLSLGRNSFNIPMCDFMAYDAVGLYIGGLTKTAVTISSVSAYTQGNIEFGIISDSLVASIKNNGEIPTGCLFTFTALGNCVNPKIQNVDTFEWIQVNVSMSAGDQLIINTYRGQKAITFIHNNVSQNYINHKVYGSTFLQLAVGTNTFVYSADENENNLEISCTFSEKYGGV